MKYVLSLCCLLTMSQGFTQLTKEQRILDSVIGWDPKNYYDRNYKPQTSTIGKQREAYINKFAEWVKASYTPVAGLGEYQRFNNPNNYSVVYSIWDVGYDYLDADKKFRPIGETGYPRFYIAANTLAGSWNIDFMCRPDEWIFTMQPDGYTPNSTEERKRKGSDPRITGNVYPFITWRNEWYAVYLAPGNKLPIIPVTRGEFLNTALNRLDYLQDSLIREDWEKESPKTDAARKRITDFRKAEVDRYRNNIRQSLIKYQGSLNEPAMVTNQQFTHHNLTAGSWDMFQGAVNATYFPVYKIDGATIARMKGAQPVWLAIIFPFATKSDGNKYYEMYTSMTQHLNYRYIYNYFYDPEKVKGIEYKPLNEEQLKMRLTDYREKNKHNLAATPSATNLPANTHFLADFTATAEGSEPADWFFYRAGSAGFSVVTLPGEKGKWLKLGKGRAIKPALLKAPWPANFTLEYDVVTDKNFTTKTGGAVELTITNKNISQNNDVSGTSPDAKSAVVKVRVEAGNGEDPDYNYRGLLRVNISNSPEPNEENFSKGISATYPLKEFTGNKSRVHISVVVNNGALSILVNGKVVLQPTDFKLTYGGPCALCGIPKDLQFRSALWNNVTDSHTDAAVYISNIRISKN